MTYAGSNVLRPSLRRNAALAPGLGVLGGGAGAGAGVAGGADAVLCSAACRFGGASRDRPRVPVRCRCRSAACVLAGRDRVPCRRHVRRLSAGADLRGDDLLVRFRARPSHCRSGACRDGGAVDGWNFAVHRPVTRFRPADPDHGAVGYGAVALLARRNGAPAAFLVLARRRRGPDAAYERCRIDPARLAHRLHGHHGARPRRVRSDRALDRRNRPRRFPVRASAVAPGLRRQWHG